MNTQHTPEPWPEHGGCMSRADYNRASACVNACAGTTTDDLLKIAEHGGWSNVSEDWKLDRERLEHQRDELLDAVHKAIWRLANLQSSTAELILREAIDKAGGK